LCWPKRLQKGKRVYQISKKVKFAGGSDDVKKAVPSYTDQEAESQIILVYHEYWLTHAGLNFLDFFLISEMIDVCSSVCDAVVFLLTTAQSTPGIWLGGTSHALQNKLPGDSQIGKTINFRIQKRKNTCASSKKINDQCCIRFRDTPAASLECVLWACIFFCASCTCNFLGIFVPAATPRTFL
jgi:hypothetical protein